MDLKDYQEKIDNFSPFAFKGYTLNQDFIGKVTQIIQLITEKLELPTLRMPLTFCTREMLMNAKKANAKRVFFEKRDLDIQHPNQYEEGIKDFKQEFINKADEYDKILAEKKIATQLSIVFNTETVKIEVSHGFQLTKFENERVQSKLESLKKELSPKNAIRDNMDTTEGAGLGIFMMLSMVVKAGFSASDFTILSNHDGTNTVLELPLKENRNTDTVDQISTKISKELTSLPSIPENIQAIQNMLDDPKITIQQIADKIGTDPALSAEILRLVNSAAFMSPKPVGDLAEAVKLVGTKGVRTLILSTAALVTLNKVNRNQLNRIWGHTQKTGFFAREMTRLLGHKKIAEDAFLGGLLHDIGKVVMITAEKETLDAIERVAQNSSYSKDILEYINFSITHAKVGSQILTEWNFPKSIIASVKHHHTPEAASEDDKVLVGIVYLANILSKTAADDIGGDQFNRAVMKLTGVKSLPELKKMQATLQSSYANRVRSFT